MEIMETVSTMLDVLIPVKLLLSNKLAKLLAVPHNNVKLMEPLLEEVLVKFAMPTKPLNALLIIQLAPQEKLI
jgi:hypothetical protein